MNFENKSELIQFVKHQTSVQLRNDASDTLNRKEDLLYTEVKRQNKNSVLGLLKKYNVRYESHISDNYFIYVR